ncbi:hypothetical protein ACVIWV_010179 [Bradyrhizobium diazoefficiens]|jgi:hypothetical protein
MPGFLCALATFDLVRLFYRANRIGVEVGQSAIPQGKIIGTLQTFEIVRPRAFDIVRQNPPEGAPPHAAIIAVAGVLDNIGDTCRNVRGRLGAAGARFV